MTLFTYQNMQAVYSHGSDCKAFLQGQLTSDINKLGFGRPIQLTSLCSSKGRVTSLFFICFISPNEFVFFLPDTQSTSIMSSLAKYSIFSKIHFNYSNDYVLFFSSYLMQYSSYSCLNHCFLKRDDFEFLFKSNELSTVEFTIINLDNRLPTINELTSGRFLPSDLDLEKLGAISFKKGCFVGQEVIARVKYLSKLKKERKNFLFEESCVSFVKNNFYDSNNKLIGEVINLVYFDDVVYVFALLKQV